MFAAQGRTEGREVGLEVSVGDGGGESGRGRWNNGALRLQVLKRSEH